MEIRQMRSFLAVADSLHFTRAAELVNISQPGISLQIQQLEEELGVKLLNRSTRTVQLTGAGKQMAKRVRAILASIDDAVNDAKTQPGARRKRPLCHNRHA